MKAPKSVIVIGIILVVLAALIQEFYPAVLIGRVMATLLTVCGIISSLFGLQVTPKDPPPHIPVSRNRAQKLNRASFQKRTVPIGRIIVFICILAFSGEVLFSVTQASRPASQYVVLPCFSFGSNNAVAWSPNSAFIAVGNSNSNTVDIWEVATKRHILTYSGHTQPVNTLAWSPDGKRIASGSDDQTVQVWDAFDGQHVLTYRGHFQHGCAVYGSVNTLAWSPDGSRIASGSKDQTVQVWDAIDGFRIYTYHGHDGSVNTLAWSPDGKRIASGSDDQTVQVWDATTGHNVMIYHNHSTSAVTALAWSPDGGRIASGSDNGTIHIWDVATGGQTFTITHQGDEGLTTLSWSPDSTRIASDTYHQKNHIEIWSATDGHTLTSLSNSKYCSGSYFLVGWAWSPDGMLIAAVYYSASGCNSAFAEISSGIWLYIFSP